MNKPDKTHNPEHDPMHELLCAYLLGEADAAETAQVEEALAASSELRAQRVQLEQTLGLVRSAYPGGEALSDAALAEVLAKANAQAEPVRPRFVLLRPAVMRAAAALVIVVTGTWAWVQRGGNAQLETQVARMDSDASATAGASGGRLSRDESKALESLGYASDEEVEARLKSMSYLGDEHALGEPSDNAAGVRAPSGKSESYLTGPSRQRDNDGPTEQQLTQLQGLGYGEDEPSPAKEDQTRFTKQERDQLVTLGYLSEEAAEADRKASDAGTRYMRIDGSVDFSDSRKSKAPGYESGDLADGQPPSAPAADPTPGSAGEVKGSGNAQGGKFGGRFGKKHGERPRESEGALEALGYGGGEVASAPSVNAPQPTGAYRGPGDTVAPGGAGPAKNQPARAVTVSELEEKFAALDEGRVLTGSDTIFLRSGSINQAPSKVSPQIREQYVRGWCETVIHDCYPRPTDLPRDMYFRFWGDNAFELTQLDSQSTFSVDVDTASYALARRYLNEGNLPTKAQIRTEEFLNSFDPDVPAPTEGVFAIQTELAPSRFSSDQPRSMLRVGIRGREVSRSERKPLAVTFVIDTSGSMRQDGRLELVKHAVRLLVGELNDKDTIAIVAYSNEARIVLPPTTADRGGVIEAAIYPLQPTGSTNAEAGLMLGYQLAQAAMKPGSSNRVVFLSDGVANTGQTDQNRIIASVRQQVDAGIYLNTIGVGMDNHNDVFLEQLADKGDGICDYVDSADAAKRAIVERFTGAFETIASDVKVQVEFDPKQVHRYRLLGYENRAVADKDFRNDAVDAGEVGAGHQVVALYELELAADAAASGEVPLATVHLRYKEPKAPGQDPLEVTVSEIDSKVFVSDAKKSFAETSLGYRRSIVVAQFAEFLRRSTHTRGDTFEALLAETVELSHELRSPDFDEFLGLVKKAYQLGPPRDRRDDLELTLDEFRRFQILRKEIDVLRKDVDDSLLKELQERNDELEEQLRDLLKGRFEKKG